MDLNRLYSDHQSLLMQADHATDDGARRLLATAASGVAGRIGRVQRTLGARAAPAWEILAASATASPAVPGGRQQGYVS